MAEPFDRGADDGSQGSGAEDGAVAPSTSEQNTPEHGTPEHGIVEHDAGGDTVVGRSAGEVHTPPGALGAGRASTENLDVMAAPIEEGRDPLSDESVERRAAGPRSIQIVFFGVLAVVFACLLVLDVVHHSWGRALLGVVVLVACGLALVRELRPQERD